MPNSRFVLAALATAIVLASCGSEPDQERIGPTAEELERMRQDSIRLVHGCAEAARQTLLETVYFDYDRVTIRPDTEAKLLAKLDILRANPSVRLRVEGHTDRQGTTEFNFLVGSSLVEEVIQFFTAFGLDAERITEVSYGETRLAVQGLSEAARAQNRRVEFVITAGGEHIGC